MDEYRHGYVIIKPFYVVKKGELHVKLIAHYFALGNIYCEEE